MGLAGSGFAVGLAICSGRMPPGSRTASGNPEADRSDRHGRLANLIRPLGRNDASQIASAFDALSSHGLTQAQGFALTGKLGVGSQTLKRFFAAGEVVICKTRWMIRDHQSGG